MSLDYGGSKARTGMRPETKALVVMFGILGLVVALGIWWIWYVAGVQVEVYRRQGITMTRWEVFVGAEPAERVVQVKEREP